VADEEHFPRHADIQEEERKWSWSAEDMKIAMKSVLVAKMSVREAAGRFNLPTSPLQDGISKVREVGEIQVPPK
jgi:transposase